MRKIIAGYGKGGHTELNPKPEFYQASDFLE
jgi:hypothetical protein